MTESLPEPRFEAVRTRFRERSLKRLARLAALADALAEVRNDELALALRREARLLLHELAGGGGSFGFAELAHQAAQLEALVACEPLALPKALRAALPLMRRSLAA